MDGIDPVKLLKVPQDYTAEDLKKAYKKLVIKLHPDIEGTGNEELFKLITKAYQKLSTELNTKRGDRQFHELKSEFKKDVRNDHKKFSGFRDPVDLTSRFNVNVFNQIFDENKFPDVTDAGYDDFLKNNPDKSEECSIKYNGNFTQDRFNKHFEKNTRHSSQSSNKHLIKYNEPLAYCTTKHIQFTDLGTENIDDFSGENRSIRDLNYMDLKLAYTTNRIVDPSTVEKRREYKSVDELKRDRKKVSFQMSPADLVREREKQTREEEREKRRVQALYEYDTRWGQHHEKVNSLLLNRR